MAIIGAKRPFSTWVLYALVGAFSSLTLFFARFMYTAVSNQGDVLGDSIGMSVKVLFYWGVMQTPLLLALITLSLIVRSRASIWLIVWLLLSDFVPIVVPLFATGEWLVKLVTVLVTGLMLCCIGLAFRYLIKSGEL